MGVYGSGLPVGQDYKSYISGSYIDFMRHIRECKAFRKQLGSNGVRENYIEQPTQCTVSAEDETRCPTNIRQKQMTFMHQRLCHVSCLVTSETYFKLET